jgi:hypothetical protein
MDPFKFRDESDSNGMTSSWKSHSKMLGTLEYYRALGNPHIVCHSIENEASTFANYGSGAQNAKRQGAGI